MPEDKIKPPILILVVLILVSLFLAGGVFYLLQKEKANNLALTGQLSDLKEQQKVSEARLLESGRLIAGLEAKLRDAGIQIETLTRDLEQAKSDREAAGSQVESLKAELAAQKRTRSELDERLVKAQSDLKKVQAELQELGSRKSELEARLKDMEGQLAQTRSKDVELGRIIVAPEGAVMPAEGKTQEGLEGKVIVINKDYNFAVVNLGSKDGVTEGDLFEVYRGSNYIGDVKIDKVHEAMSAAGFLTAGVKDKIVEGDKVVQKKK